MPGMMFANMIEIVIVPRLVAGANASPSPPSLRGQPYPVAAARGSDVLDFAGVSRTPTAATIAANAANPASA
jgi:hypothetical protein